MSTWWKRALHRRDQAQADLRHDAAGHAVYYYGEEQELLDRLEDYVTDGWSHGQRTVVFARHERIKALRLRLAGRELLEALDAHEASWALSQFVRDGRPQAGLFTQLVSETLARQGHGSVRLYGEMVAVLWDEGNVTGALELEALWNSYLAEHPLALLCAYPRADVAGHAEHGAVCRAHDHVFPQAR
jgi:hypothetical protein